MNAYTSGYLLELDFHLDPYYVEGASVSSFCHRKDGAAGKGTAGKFGALGSDCDSPKALVRTNNTVQIVAWKMNPFYLYRLMPHLSS